MTQTKYCIDCEHMTTEENIIRSDADAICNIPDERTTYDIVWGKTTANQKRYCKTERGDQWGPKDDHCGLQGKYFKPKENPVIPMSKRIS